MLTARLITMRKGLTHVLSDTLIRRLQRLQWLDDCPVATIEAFELLDALRRVEGRNCHETARREL
jgi:hypothetical protein